MKQSLFRFCDGRVVSGVLYDEVPPPVDARTLQVSLAPDSPPQSVELRDLKAVFILRPADLNVPESADEVTVSVNFFDGETIRGRTSGWIPGRPTFLLIPDDASKVEAVLVVSSALVGLEVEGGTRRE